MPMTLHDYTLRYSKKAKRLQLRISRFGLEVVAPAFNPPHQRLIEAFIHQKESWIKRNLDRTATFYGKKQTIELPKQIVLMAINQTWEVIYLPSDGGKVRLFSNQANEIKLVGDIHRESFCLRLLRDWLKKLAGDVLPKHLNILSIETGLTYQAVSIRNNLTRWGSCNSQQDISLCCKILFLPPMLMRHVLLHELCHTKIMNHGLKFWKLLERFDPACRLHSKQLKDAALQMPVWLINQ